MNLNKILKKTISQEIESAGKSFLIDDAKKFAEINNLKMPRIGKIHTNNNSIINTHLLSGGGNYWNLKANEFNIQTVEDAANFVTAIYASHGNSGLSIKQTVKNRLKNKIRLLLLGAKQIS